MKTGETECSQIHKLSRNLKDVVLIVDVTIICRDQKSKFPLRSRLISFDLVVLSFCWAYFLAIVVKMQRTKRKYSFENLLLLHKVG